MLSPDRLWRRAINFLAMRRRDVELNEELSFHVAMETEKHMHRGVDAVDANRRAVRDFGSVARVRDETRDTHGIRALEDFVHDVRVGVRNLLRQRTFAATAILTLAIGIGGTTAVFGAVYGVLLAPLPYREQSRVMTVWQTDTKHPGSREEASVPNFIDWRDRSHVFSHLALGEPFSLDYLGPDGVETFRNAIVTEGFFEALGVTPMLGRNFVHDEFTAGRDNVVMLSETLWRQRFGADIALIGRKVTLDGAPMIVVGIVPKGVDVPFDAVAWTPKVFRDGELQARGSDYFRVVGRLRDGVAANDAQREMTAIAEDLSRTYPKTNATTGVAVIPIGEALLGSSRSGLLVLFGAIAFVLLIACVNVASLQLAQSIRRRREFATRATLGAGAGRIARQLLTESLVLALTGGALGVGLAYWGLAAIRAIAPADLPRATGMQLQPVVLVFALIITICAALFFGLAPVVGVRRLRLTEVVSSGGRSHMGSRRRRRLQRGLVVAEIALALILLVGAGLLVRSFRTLVTVDRGFTPDRVLVATIQAWSYYPTGPARTEFVRQTLDRLRALPGVRMAGVTSALPLSAPIGAEGATIVVEGWPTTDGQNRTARMASVTPGYFSALQIPFRAGRMLDELPPANSNQIVVNEAFARRYWPDGSAIGKHVVAAFQSAPREREIVGIVADVRRDGLDHDAAPTIYFSHSDAPTGAINFVIATEGVPRTLEKPTRATLASMNASMPISSMATLDELFASSVRGRRFYLALIGAFSLTALALAAIGIYGVLSQMTGERTQEIGVRVAIGASSGQVLGMVVRQGVMLAISGIAAGLVGAVFLSQLIKGMLFQITPLDPLTYAAALGALMVTALFACAIPAVRAARIDPIRALRGE